MDPETQKMREHRGRNTKGGKYGQEWYDGPLRKYPIETLIPRVTNFIGHNDNHQGEIRKNV